MYNNSHWMKKAIAFLLAALVLSLCVEAYQSDGLLDGTPPKFETVEELREYLLALNNYWKHVRTTLKTR